MYVSPFRGECSILCHVLCHFFVQREKEGFKKSSRPNTASVDRNGDISYFNEGNPASGTSRPTTAGAGGSRMNFPGAAFYNTTGQRPGSARFNNTGTGSRPQTGAPQISYRGATPLFSGAEFNPPEPDDVKAHSRPATGIVPTYVTMDKLVARFYAHFFEERNWDRDGPLGDPQMEKQICRLVTIQFYLYDKEVQILEPKVTNAGE